MFKIVRLVILFAVVAGMVFGFVYGIVRSAQRRRQERLAREKQQVLERLRALAEAQAKGELTKEQADELSYQVYLDAKDRGLDITKEPEARLVEQKEPQ